MTAREIYKAMLVELNKVESPSLLLEDYNYFLNKAISLYINTYYNVYDVNQQMSDNLRVLKATAVLTPIKMQLNAHGDNALYGVGKNYQNVWEVDLPSDYYHILNCTVTYNVKERFGCYTQGSTEEFPVYRLTSDTWPQIVQNAYMKPSYRRPYYFIHHVNQNTEVPTNPYENDKNYGLGKNTDPIVKVDENGRIKLTGLSRSLTNIGQDEDMVNKVPGIRYGNASNVRMELRYGMDDSVFEPAVIRVDYLKTPLFVELTQDQIDKTQDTSQIMEFPDYACQEIINTLVKLVMENAGNPRLQTNVPINQTIAIPGQGTKQ